MKPLSLCAESLLPRFFPDGGEEGVDGGPAAHERLHFGPDLRNGGIPPVGLVLELVDLHAGLNDSESMEESDFPVEIITEYPPEKRIPP